MQVSSRIFAFFVFACSVPSFRTLTPPRIIYGGWTPIVPGHPFYFGPARHYEHPHHQHVLYGDSALTHMPEHLQVEYVRPVHYQDTSPVHYPSYDKSHTSHAQYQSGEKPHGGPVHYQYQAKSIDDTPHYQSYKSVVSPGPYQSFHQSAVNPGHQSYSKASDKPGHYHQSHEPATGPVRYQSKEVEQQVEYISPVEHKSHEKPKEIYRPPTHHTGPPIEDHEHITYGHKPDKDIYAYYPPRSAYEGPRVAGRDYKPVYFEIPKKPLDIVHGAGLTSLPIDLKSIYPVGAKTSLRIKPLNLDALKHIGHLNAGQLHRLVPDVKYPVLKDSSGGVPIKPTFLPLGYKNYAPIHAPFTVGRLPKSSVNTYEGDAAQQNEYMQLKRPLNPIETKYIRKAHLNLPLLKPYVTRVPGLGRYKHLNLPVLHPAHPYAALRHVHLTKPQVLYRPAADPSPVESYMAADAPSFHTLGPPAITAEHPSLRRPASRPSSMVTDYLRKGVRLHSLYRNPAYVANIRGSPAIVEREVAIIHVPVGDSEAHPDSEFLYHTASTPESAQILDASKLNRTLLNQHRLPSMRDNQSYTHITLNNGKGVEHVTLVEPTQIDPPVGGRYIFVSSNGVRGKDVENSVDHPEAQKQFFHAYYGPPDHVPPAGYVRMTVPEFNRLFSNAEIRYVNRGDLETQPSAKREDRALAETKS